MNLEMKNKYIGHTYSYSPSETPLTFVFKFVDITKVKIIYMLLGEHVPMACIPSTERYGTGEVKVNLKASPSLLGDEYTHVIFFDDVGVLKEYEIVNSGDYERFNHCIDKIEE